MSASFGLLAPFYYTCLLILLSVLWLTVAAVTPRILLLRIRNNTYWYLACFVKFQLKSGFILVHSETEYCYSMLWKRVVQHYPCFLMPTKQTANSIRATKKLLASAGGVVDPVKISPHLIQSPYKVGCCFSCRVRICRRAQKFGECWGPAPFGWGHGWPTINMSLYLTHTYYKWILLLISVRLIQFFCQFKLAEDYFVMIRKYGVINTEVTTA